MKLDSLINELDALGILLWAEGGQLRFRAPAGALTDEHRALLTSHKKELIARLSPETGALRTDPQHRHDPFPLTDVQAAYLVGRGSAYAYGGVGCHGYVELDMPDLDPARLEQAWHRLIARHDMLRATITQDGWQQVQEHVSLPALETDDLRNQPEDKVQASLDRTRTAMSEKCYTPHEWPLYELRLSRCNQFSRLHLSLDLLIADFVSIQIMLTELDQLYRMPEKPLPSLTLTFRDAVLALRHDREQAAQRARFARDRAYWMARIPDMPGAPELPVQDKPAAQAPVTFSRHAMTLSSAQWHAFCRLAAERRTTPTCAILAAFADTIGRWSRHPDYCLNLTVLNRPAIHPEIDRIIGDFTSTSVLQIRPQEKSRFAERAAQLQQQLWEDMEHAAFSGIEVLREMGRDRQQRDFILPIVFTSTLGMQPMSAETNADGEFMQGARLGYGITQTPQVWLDCQVAERAGTLYVNWDIREGVFPPGLIEDAFAAFSALLLALANDAAIWQDAQPLALPANTLQTREQSNDTAVTLPEGRLHDGFHLQAQHQPDAIAIIDAQGPVSYGALLQQTRAIAQALLDSGCQPGDLVAIALDKTRCQIASVLGVLWVGAAYLPLDTEQPQTRRDAILRDAGVQHVLTDAAGLDGAWPQCITAIATDALAVGSTSAATMAPADFEATSLAYVIYTSGTTGKPKGVMMTHLAALNTVADINARFGIHSGDRILGLANLAFDLSVYDIFGTLAAGGTLVLPHPERRRDPSHWAACMIANEVTVWNSVPAQMQMLATFLESDPRVCVSTLRVALLSGDWIPVGLPAVMRAHIPGLRIISLGGATEAGIWSIWHDIGTVPANARSIPYGRPLANQTFHVLDTMMRPCPDQVPGELYIGGTGLALGYLNDPGRTEERFIDHPATGERLYRTGDLGKYRPDGVIEFLGREDNQVKIRGHRIELGEIESVLQSHPDIGMAVALACGESAQERHLAAFFEAAVLPKPDGPADHSMITQAANTAGDQSIAALDRDAFLQWVNTADDIARLNMLAAFRECGLFSKTGESHRVDQIIQSTGAIESNHRLIRRWLRNLAEAGWLDSDEQNSAYTLLREPAGNEAERRWEQLEQLEQKIHYSSELLRYLRESGGQLPGLLRGEVDPLDLLFPQGTLDTAVAAYNDNQVNRCMNAVVCAAVREIAKNRKYQQDSQRPLRILEIGAGVGGTSRALIPAVADFPVDYLYSDVSPFFLNAARERHGDYPWVRYGLFDLNQDYVSQGLQAASWDVIVCSNVLHNAHHAPTVLSRLRELGAPGCALIVIEATREIAALMTSMEFQTGLSGFTDEREALDQTFFTRDQWERLFAEAQGEMLCAYPPPDEAIASVGQVAFVVRLPETRKITYEPQIRDYLRQRLPEYMLPLRLEALHALPLSRNGKVDRNALKQRVHVAAQPTIAAPAEQPMDELESRLIGIWETALGRTGLGRNDDFFQAGGDSLLIAQVVAKMREQMPEAKDWEWDRLMREVLRRPTATATAAALRVSVNGSDTATAHAASPLLSLVSGKAQSDAIHVLVHDGSGTLAPYRALLPLLEAAPERTGEIVGLMVPDAQAYLARPAERLICDLATEYATLLATLGASRIHLIGYCMGGLLATEIARVLLDAGIQVDPVTAISSDRFRYHIDDDLLLERAFGGLLGADISAAGHHVDDTLLARALLQLRKQHGDHIPPASLQSLNGELKPVADCYARLANIPAAERRAALVATMSTKAWEVPEAQIENQFRIFKHSLAAVSRYQPEAFAGDLHLLLDNEALHFLPGLQPDMRSFWNELALGDVRIDSIRGNHLNCLQPPHVNVALDHILRGQTA